MPLYLNGVSTKHQRGKQVQIDYEVTIRFVDANQRHRTKVNTVGNVREYLRYFADTKQCDHIVDYSTREVPKVLPLPLPTA